MIEYASQLVPILGTQITQLGLLVLRQAQVRNRTISAPILMPTSQPVKTTRDDRQGGESKAETVATGVIWRLLGKESIDSDDT